MTMTGEQRFAAWPALGVDPRRAVQIIRTYDGRVFAMSVDEARTLAIQLERAAAQAQARRSPGGFGEVPCGE